MTFASLYNLTTVKESVNLGSMPVKEVEISKQDWEEIVWIWKKKYVSYNKWCTYVHITRELFHAWIKDGIFFRPLTS